MSKKQPPRVQFDFEPEYTEETEDVGTMEAIDHHPSITAEINDEDSESVMLPEVIEEPIVEKEIFDMGETIKEPVVEPVVEPVQKKPTKINKNGKPRKPMSEEHKKKLAASREKALQSRKLKAEERKKAKALENEERELLKAQKVKRVQKLREEVSGDTESPPPQPSAPQSTQSFTREDLERAQLDAIIKYEALRKSRKEEKKKKEMIEKQQQEMRNKIKRATEPQQYKYRDGSNPWDNCY
jgi:uncharacterized protein with von Willebrand factor type A (vWA) domain